MPVITLTKDNFENEVIKSQGCAGRFLGHLGGPCQMLSPVVEKLSDEVKDVNLEN